MPKKLRELNRIYLRLLVTIIITVAFFGVYIYLCGWREVDMKSTGPLALAIYVVLIVVSGIIWRLFDRSFISASVTEAASPLGGVTLDVLTRFRQPILICDDAGVIIWYNRELVKCAGKRGTLYGKNLDSICSASPTEILAAESDEGLDVSAFNISWGIRGYRITSQNKNYILMVWHNRSDLKAAYKTMSEENTVVAYIMIDNLEELMQYVQEKYRSVSGEIDSILKNWAASVSGIIMEYERDRYFFIFNAKSLSRFIADRFDILDRIRDTRIGEGSLPVTLSIGISGTVGSFAEKDRAARTALDMALQRGGDQAVVRTENGLEFYGGRSKSVQKRTKVRARMAAGELAVLISKSSDVLIMGHRNMDFDALGSCVGLARMAMFCGVTVHIIANTGDRNLAKCFDRLRRLPEYENIFVDAADAQEILSSETLLIITDVNNKPQYEAPDVAENAFTIAIVDHHRKTAEFKTAPAISYIEPSASSSCELVSEILELSMPAGQLKAEEADIMFAGILLDTKQFSRNTGARTFSAALFLRAEGADPSEAQAMFKTNFDDYVREAKFSSNVNIYRDVYAIAVNNDADNTSSDRIAAAKAADKLLTVDGVAASFAVARIGGQIIISARSAGTVNVQLIIERLGGGGHFDAAATAIESDDINEVLDRLRASIDEYEDEE